LSRAGSRPLKTLGLWIGLSLVPVAFLEALRWLANAPFSLGEVAVRWRLVVGVLLAARFGAVRQVGQGRWLWPWRGVAILGAAAVLALGYAWSQATSLAWLTIGGLYALLLILTEGVWGLTAAVRRRGVRSLGRATALGTALAAGGLVPVAIGQIESHFADEEFFVLVQALALALFAGLVQVIHLWLSSQRVRARQAGLMVSEQKTYSPTCFALTKSKLFCLSARRGLCLSARWVLIGVVLFSVAGGWATVRSYQASFYPPEAPTFEGISADQPFLCGETASLKEGHPDGEAVFHRLLARVEANPRKRPPEYGMLALGTGERRWAGAFRESLLREAAEGRFTGPAHSVKSVQYEAALRLYYLWKIPEAFPDLLSEADQSLLRDWFAAINKRALAVELVDWMYALAFSKWPEGPYENQENGAGLLALLELSDYAAPELSAANRDYLARNERGWQARFRNSDDALVYQPEWITNAFFQSLYTDHLSARNQRFAFEWLLLQNLPDGAILRYNHPARAPVVGMAYLGAYLLNDSSLLWLADRSLTQVEAEGKYLCAQPGLEAPVTFQGEPPTDASCLLYGDSGLPNQVGPLAPDKIVFRDSWSSDSAYALLNLRFTGWHRYKATNTISLLYQGGPLVVEHTLGQPFAWLPEGRSLFRDKRIPRENLNGLLIERTGMSAVLYKLTGIGGPWAQDPPYYAEVERFEALGPLDISRTVLDGWRGWRHERTVYFVHGGAVVVVDEATSRSGGGSSAAVSWHLVGEEQREGESLWLRQEEGGVRVVWPSEAWSFMGLESEPVTASDQPSLRVLYRSPHRGRLNLATTWLTGAWADSQYQMTTLRERDSDRVLGYHLSLSSAAGTLDLLHNATPDRLETDGLATDGEAVVVWRALGGKATVCGVGGSFAEVALASQPDQVMVLEGETLPPGEAWEWRGGRLVIHNVGDSWCVKTQ